MASTSCLGLYVEENIIKYAKVSKDHDNIKVESFGIKFYEKIGDAIKQLIQETYSQKTPISINLSEEMYNYFDMFALLTKSDLQKAIKTEFDSFCTEKGYNPNVFETRYAVVGNQDDKEKIKVIHVAENKIELDKRAKQVEGYRLSTMTPVAMAIPSLLNTNAQEEENCLIVNIEESTRVTTILQNQIYNVDIIEEGSKDFLAKINLKENSYSNSYEICKNTTIYTSEGKELQAEQSSYLEDIMPTLYSIVGKVKEIIANNAERIRKVYISGTAALINNIDLYFQEFLGDIDCEILKPYFIQNTKDISIKDYIEVNSAISMGLMGIGEGIEGMNFKNPTFTDRLPDWMKRDIDPSKALKNRTSFGGILVWDLGQKLDRIETYMVRVAVAFLLLVIIYSGFSGLLASQMKKKHQEADESISSTNEQISLANADNEKIKTRTNNYSTMIRNLEEANNKITDRNKTRNAIPNLLNQIMMVIPDRVQLTSIENTTGTHIVITAQSSKYEQLGIFVSKIKADVILANTIATSGQKDNSIVTIKIEGELP